MPGLERCSQLVSGLRSILLAQPVPCPVCPLRHSFILLPGGIHRLLGSLADGARVKLLLSRLSLRCRHVQQPQAASLHCLCTRKPNPLTVRTASAARCRASRSSAVCAAGGLQACAALKGSGLTMQPLWLQYPTSCGSAHRRPRQPHQSGHRSSCCRRPSAPRVPCLVLLCALAGCCNCLARANKPYTNYQKPVGKYSREASNPRRVRIKPG